MMQSPRFQVVRILPDFHHLLYGADEWVDGLDMFMHEMPVISIPDKPELGFWKPVEVSARITDGDWQQTLVVRPATYEEIGGLDHAITDLRARLANYAHWKRPMLIGYADESAAQRMAEQLNKLSGARAPLYVVRESVTIDNNRLFRSAHGILEQLDRARSECISFIAELERSAPATEAELRVWLDGQEVPAQHIKSLNIEEAKPAPFYYCRRHGRGWCAEHSEHYKALFARHGRLSGCLGECTIERITLDSALLPNGTSFGEPVCEECERLKSEVSE